MTRQDIPNLLTHLRLALAPLVFLGLAAAGLAFPLLGLGAAAALIFASLALFVVAAATDYFDGWLARRWNAGSAWGATLDPIGDKLAVTAAILGLLVVQPRLTVAVAGAVILFREVFVSGLREATAPLGLRLPVTRAAKWKTAVQLVALSLEMAASGAGVAAHAAGHAQGWLLALFPVADALLWLAAALTALTGAQYAVAARAALSRTGA